MTPSSYRGVMEVTHNCRPSACFLNDIKCLNLIHDAYFLSLTCLILYYRNLCLTWVDFSREKMQVKRFPKTLFLWPDHKNVEVELILQITKKCCTGKKCVRLLRQRMNLVLVQISQIHQDIIYVYVYTFLLRKAMQILERKTVAWKKWKQCDIFENNIEYFL